jgi:hypothetical protein
MENNWISHKSIDFNNDEITEIHIDTRDFYCFIPTPTMESEREKFEGLIMADEFYYSLNEIKDIVEDLFNKSGGETIWRFLTFQNKITCGWELKYIRFYKTNSGFVAVTNKNKCREKSFWLNPLDTSVLNAEDAF